MIFNRFSVTFDEIKYNQNDLKDWLMPFLPYKVTLANKSNGTCDIIDTRKHEGLDVKDYALPLRLAKLFTLYDEEASISDQPIRLFIHEAGQGILPHIDQAADCAINFPIIPKFISPILYLKQGDKVGKPGDFWEWSDFNLTDIIDIHQYIPGSPSLICSKPFIHSQVNYSDETRVILRIKISCRSFDECVQMCKDDTFINYDNLEKFIRGEDY